MAGLPDGLNRPSNRHSNRPSKRLSRPSRGLGAQGIEQVGLGLGQPVRPAVEDDRSGEVIAGGHPGEGPPSRETQGAHDAEGVDLPGCGVSHSPVEDPGTARLHQSLTATRRELLGIGESLRKGIRGSTIDDKPGPR